MPFASGFNTSRLISLTHGSHHNFSHGRAAAPEVVLCGQWVIVMLPVGVPWRGGFSAGGVAPSEQGSSAGPWVARPNTD